MRKDTAIAETGGSPTQTAKNLNISRQAVRKWPDPLTDDIENRVLAYVARRELPLDRLKQLGLDVRGKAAEERAEA